MSRTTTATRHAIESRRVEQVYSVLARVYDTTFDWALGPGRRRAVAALKTRPGDRILEVGVGTGLSIPLYPEDCRLTGIDITEPMLEQARERAAAMGRSDVVLRTMDAQCLELEDASFDHVVAPYVISVVPEPEKAMREIRRVCRPGGTVVVVNHFRGQNPMLRFAERLVTPASRWVGFSLDVPAKVVTGTAGLETRTVERVNMLGLWRLIVMSRTA